MNRLSQKSRMGVYLLLSFWFIIGVAYYRNFNLTIILPLFFLVVLQRILSKQFTFYIKKQNIFLILFVAYYSFVSFLFLKSTPSLTNFVIRYILLPTIAFGSTSLYINTKRIKLFFIGCMKYLIILFALFGIYEWRAKYNPIGSFITTGATNWIKRMNEFANIVYYPSSFFTHYTYFAYVLLVGWLLSLIFPSNNKLFDYSYKGTILFALMISQSRMAWITFVIITMIHYFFFAKKVKISWLISVPIVFIVLNISGFINKIVELVSSRFDRVISLGYSDGSFGQRFGTLQNVIPYMSEHPIKAIIGGGYGSALFDFLPQYSYYFGFQTTDSVLTTYLIEVGIIGCLLLFIALFIYISSIDKTNSFNKLTILLLVMTLIEMFFFDFFANNITLFLFYMVWGAMITHADDELGEIKS
ncbi:O-antigen ligase family protein [Streptococcus mitis]|uniref:O-Antigen ligase n=1 Tax=Streptococcus mitis TaxID=28037 RepID=A0A3R9KGE2_STRMT|nr:O-antigen ligase family protein [Streptococcus mitis]RSJ04377.1 O-Antigen ligase [Streptococcus mitis]